MVVPLLSGPLVTPDTLLPQELEQMEMLALQAWGGGVPVHRIPPPTFPVQVKLASWGGNAPSTPRALQ